MRAAFFYFGKQAVAAVVRVCYLVRCRNTGRYEVDVSLLVRSLLSALGPSLEEREKNIPYNAILVGSKLVPGTDLCGIWLSLGDETR